MYVWFRGFGWTWEGMMREEKGERVVLIEFYYVYYVFLSLETEPE